MGDQDQDSLTERMGALSGAIFLFGLAALFMLDVFWPGILLLIFVVSIPPLLAESGWRHGLWILAQMVIWLGGIPLLIAWGFIFPGVLILAGMSALLAAIAPPEQLEQQHKERRAESIAKRKRKQKRGDAVPLPPDGWQADDDWLAANWDDPGAGEDWEADADSEPAAWQQTGQSK